MNRQAIVATLLAAGLTQACVAASPGGLTQPARNEVSIPFAAHGGIRDWEAEGDKAILLRDRANRWYRATFLGTCPRIGYGQTLIFNTDAGGSFDRFSTIQSEYGVCQIGSVVPAAAPLSRGGR